MNDAVRLGIVGYGSILDLDDTDDVFADLESRAVPIKAHGFKRIFNQRASWRDVDGNRQAVLNVVPSDSDWFNGILIPDLSRSEFSAFRERERGYRLLEIEPDEIEPYEPDAIAESAPAARSVPEQELLLVPTGRKVDDEIEPIEDYVSICRRGAEQWGETFLDDFLRTTELNSGETLESYSVESSDSR